MRQMSILVLVGLFVTLVAVACGTVAPPPIQQASRLPDPPTQAQAAQATAIPTATSMPANEGEPGFAGRWEGTLDVQGTELDVVVNLAADGDDLVGTVDVPTQGAEGLELDNVRAENGQLSFELLASPSPAKFTGERTADDTIVGELEQAGVKMALTLTRSTGEAAVEPTEPVPYVVEDVAFENGDVTLAGTLTLPDRQGPHPAIVLISGSGPQKRNEEIPSIPDYKPFQVIADHLTRQGIAVLRYDDRGVGESTGNHATVTSADLADDAEAGLAFLRNRAEIDPAQVGLLGHSEGGLIAAMVAARNPNVAFVVSMAGTAVSGYDLLLTQNERILRASGATEEEIEAGIAEARLSMDLNLAEDWDALEELAYEVGRKEIEALPEEQREALGDPETYLENQVRQAMPFWKNWMHFFLAHDPAEDWSEVEVPVLALFGDLDTQVDVGQNRPALEAALEEAGNEDVTVVVFPTANHLFLAAETGSPDEYAELNKAFVPGFLDTITDWLLARVDTAAEQAVALSRDEKWAANLDFVVRALPQYHINPFFKVSQQSFTAAAAELRAAIPDLTDEEIVVRLSQLVAMLGDEHTGLAWTKEQPGLYFPINFLVFDDGIYVVATTPEYAEALGSRLVSLAGIQAATVLEQLASLIPHANRQWVNAQAMHRINSVDLLLGLGIIPDQGPQPFTFERADGELFTRTLEPFRPTPEALAGLEWRYAPAPEDRPLALQSRPPGNYWLEYLADSDTMYVQYNVCANAAGYPFEDFVTDVFAVVEEQPVRRFVVDVRHNRGGNSLVMQPLLGALKEHPEVNQTGRLYVIIGRDTFSSGLLNAIELQQQTEAILVGEPTGASPNHYGEVRTVQLPYFGLTLAYSTKHFEYMKGNPEALVPDVVIDLTAEDYFASRDPFLEAVLADRS